MYNVKPRKEPSSFGAILDESESEKGISEYRPKKSSSKQGLWGSIESTMKKRIDRIESSQALTSEEKKHAKTLKDVSKDKKTVGELVRAQPVVSSSPQKNLGDYIMPAIIAFMVIEVIR